MRTPRGLELYDAALAAGVLRIEHALTFADLDRYQPHQVRKRRAVWARLKGRERAGKPVPVVLHPSVKDCARQNSIRENLAEYHGARTRATAGRLDEPPASGL